MTREEKLAKLEKEIDFLRNKKKQILSIEKKKERKAINHAKFILAGLVLKELKEKNETLNKYIEACTKEEDKKALEVLKKLL